MCAVLISFAFALGIFTIDNDYKKFTEHERKFKKPSTRVSDNYWRVGDGGKACLWDFDGHIWVYIEGSTYKGGLAHHPECTNSICRGK